MTLEQARKIVRAAAIGDGCFPVRARYGPDLQPSEIELVIAAIRTIFDDLGGADQLDRDLASNLHYLGFLVLRELDTIREHGGRVGDALFHAVLKLENAVESVFLGSWLE